MKRKRNRNPNKDLETTLKRVRVMGFLESVEDLQTFYEQSGGICDGVSECL